MTNCVSTDNELEKKLYKTLKVIEQNIVCAYR